MKAPKHKQKWAYDHTKFDDESNTHKPSITVQDDSYTIDEIINRYQNGIEPRRKDPNYNDIPLDEINQFHSAEVDRIDLQHLKAKHQQIEIDLQLESQKPKDELESQKPKDEV